MLFRSPWNLPDLLQISLWSDIFRGIMKHPDMLILMAEFCLVILSVIVLLIAVIYLALSIGHMVSRHRNLVGVAAFIGLYILLVNLYDRVFSYKVVRPLLDMTTANAYGSMLTAVAAMLIPAAAFLAVTCWILEHKLNLE